MKEKTAYCSLTYLWSFTPEELGLPHDCSKEELEDAAEAHMRELVDAISHMADIYPNDLEVSVA